MIQTSVAGIGYHLLSMKAWTKLIVKFQKQASKSLATATFFWSIGFFFLYQEDITLIDFPTRGKQIALDRVRGLPDVVFQSSIRAFRQEWIVVCQRGDTAKDLFGDWYNSHTTRLLSLNTTLVLEGNPVTLTRYKGPLRRYDASELGKVFLAALKHFLRIDTIHLHPALFVVR